MESIIKFTDKEVQEYPYVVEVMDHEEFNSYTGEDSGYTITKEEKRFKSPVEALEYFYQWRIRRDFCFGDNFWETENTVERWEVDEGGSTTFVLYKWPDFNEWRKSVYKLSKDSEEYVVEGYQAFFEKVKELWGEGAYIHWEDDHAGTLGWPAKRNEDGMREFLDGQVEARYRIRIDKEREEKHEAWEKRKEERNANVRVVEEDNEELQALKEEGAKIPF